MIPKSDHFREHIAGVVGGFDAAHFTDSRGGTFRFDDQADHLNDAAASLSDVRGADAVERGVEAIA